MQSLYIWTSWQYQVSPGRYLQHMIASPYLSITAPTLTVHFAHPATSSDSRRGKAEMSCHGLSEHSRGYAIVWPREMTEAKHQKCCQSSGRLSLVVPACQHVSSMHLMPQPLPLLHYCPHINLVTSCPITDRGKLSPYNFILIKFLTVFKRGNLLQIILFIIHCSIPIPW